MSDNTVPLPVSHTITVDGAQLRCVVEGQGYPCLVVGSSTFYRRTFSQPLKELLRCAFMDHRGTLSGATTGAHEQYTIDLITDDIEQVRRTLGWERVVVYGQSIQGLMALEYAYHYPEQVSHVVMEATPPYWGEAFEQARQAAWDSTASAERKALVERNRQGIEERLRGLSDAGILMANIVADAPRLWADPTYDPSWLYDGTESNMEVIGQIFGSTFSGYDVLARQAPVPAPVFVAVGRHDYSVPFTTWDEHRRAIGDLTVVLFEQSGHYPHLEEPERFADELARWLRQHGGSSAAHPR